MLEWTTARPYVPTSARVVDGERAGPLTHPSYQRCPCAAQPVRSLFCEDRSLGPSPALGPVGGSRRAATDRRREPTRRLENRDGSSKHSSADTRAHLLLSDDPS